MSYKDKDKQKEAQRNWVRQNRAKKVRQEQGLTGQTDKVRQATDVTDGVATTVAASFDGDVMTVESMSQAKTDLPDGEYVERLTATEIPTHFKDAVGNVHKIDYEGRRRDYALLESWRRGEGSEWQRRMGVLSEHYRILKGVDLNRYLGVV